MNVYEVIFGLRISRKMNSKQLAELAGIPPTTLATTMSRRPLRVSKDFLKSIAAVFELQWYELLGKESEDELAESENRVSAQLGQAETIRVMHGILNGVNPSMYGSFRLEGEQPQIIHNESRIMDVHHRSTHTSPNFTSDENQFRQSIFFILNRLNDAGLMEAMRRVLDIAQDPKFCKPSAHSEDTQSPTSSRPTDAEE